MTINKLTDYQRILTMPNTGIKIAKCRQEQFFKRQKNKNNFEGRLAYIKEQTVVQKDQFSKLKKSKFKNHNSQQLQQQLQQAFSSDLTKRKITNKQFKLIFIVQLNLHYHQQLLKGCFQKIFLLRSDYLVFYCEQFHFFNQNLELMIQNESLHELGLQSRSQLPKVNRTLNNSQKIVSENHSENNLQVQSQKIDSKDNTFKLQYKKKLIQLMVMVRFQKFGFNNTEIMPIIQFYLDKIHHLDRVNNRHLSDQAGKVFLKVFSALIGQNWVQFRLQPSEHAIEQQREMEMPRQPLVRRLVFEPERIRVQPPSQGTILCNICYTVSSHVCEQECGHSFCVQCMKGYLKQNLRSDNYFVKCPEYECNNLVSLRTVKQMLGPNDYKRFLYFRQKNEKQMNPENKFCSAPDCGQILQNQRSKLVCPKCSVGYCQVCLQQWHQGQACDVALGNELERTYQNFQIKKCPGCKSPIEKSDGCNHMTCKKCKFQFCWLCQKKYSKHHYRYYNCFGCPGMQYQGEDQVVVERFKQVCLYILLPIVLVFLLFFYLGCLPIYIIANFFYRPCLWNKEGTQMVQYRMSLKICCEHENIFLLVLRWLLFQPRALLYAVFISPVRLTMIFCGELGAIFE